MTKPDTARQIGRAMWKYHTAGWALLGLCLCHSLSAQTGAVLNYQGRISINHSNFSGTARFVFSLHDAGGNLLWSSGAIPVAGSTNVPVGAVTLDVRDGVYTARLGDTTTGMPPLEMARLETAPSVFLRVWFNDGQHGWQATAGDAPLPVPPGTQTITRAEADAIRRELRELRTMLQRQSGAPRAPPEPPQMLTLVVGDGPSIGASNAPVVLVEFSDFECGFCKRAQDELLTELRRLYVETGKLRIVYRNMPANFHANASPAAVAALCAHEQGQFWPMRDRLFANQAALTKANFLKFAEELKLNSAAFTACLDNPMMATRVAKDREFAKAAGIPGTPAFVLGRSDGKFLNGSVLVGVQPVSVFSGEIERLLKSSKPQP